VSEVKGEKDGKAVTYMIHIHIRLHGALRDKLPPGDKGQTILELPQGVSVTAILNQLSLHGHIQIAINQEIVENLETVLQDGDRMEVFRPAAGG